MNIEEVRDTTDQARSFNEWFEDEWKRNGVNDLIKHNDQLIANVKHLLSIIEQTEKFLEVMSDYVMDSDKHMVKKRIDQVLQAIRGK